MLRWQTPTGVHPPQPSGSAMPKRPEADCAGRARSVGPLARGKMRRWRT